jgi:hypothetical protein
MSADRQIGLVRHLSARIRVIRGSTFFRLHPKQFTAMALRIHLCGGRLGRIP